MAAMKPVSDVKAGFSFSASWWFCVFGLLRLLTLIVRVLVRVALFVLADAVAEGTDRDATVDRRRLVRLSLYSNGLDRRDWTLAARASAVCGRSASGTLLDSSGATFWVPLPTDRCEGIRQLDLTTELRFVEFVRWPFGRATVVLTDIRGGRRWLSTRTSNLDRVLRLVGSQARATPAET